MKNDNSMETKNEANPQNAREHLANERTLLAWIRTSVGIMAFGFVVVKFSLFVRQFALLLGKNAELPPQHGYSSVIGIALVGVGALVLVLSFIKFKQTESQLNSGTFKPSSTLVLALTVVILIVSMLLVFYLFESVKGY